MPERAPTPHPADPQDGEADEVVSAVLTASRLLVAVSARSLASVEETLTLPQFRMLVVLSTRGPMNISRLGTHLDVIPSTAMRMVERLTGAGMLERELNPRNRREILIRLTTEGRRVVDTATDRRRAEIARIVGGMPPAHRTALVEALRAFNEAGDEPPAAEQAAPARTGTDMRW
ncbi:MarR family winged helix-turn-helix transcriptional regulator [Streptomyces sp. NRRL F-5126]|uniref:MarR family winged helix-turn-helix transcriptional regulator n=1 Tax=Streptomyces sp. NRRL F-5126 TaxID=1463857 RepID=UPI0004CC6E35|nr:MarR family transcriptional regulator [Streptomyces sp. NRRL F-5126]